MARTYAQTPASYYARARRLEADTRRYMSDAREAARRGEYLRTMGNEDAVRRNREMVSLSVRFARSASRSARYYRDAARFAAKMIRFDRSHVATEAR